MLPFLLLAAGGARAVTLSVYSDSLQPGFEDWGWAVHSYTNPSPVHAGTASVSFEPDGFQGLYIRGGVTVGTYTALEFWIRGAGAGGQGVRLDFVDAGGSPIAGMVIPPASISNSAWTKVTVTFASLGIPNGSGVSGFWFQDTTNTNQSAVYLDDIAFTGPDIPLTVAVDPSLDRRAVSPDIYGVNWGNGTRNAQMGYPVVRWGGNPITRYNWQVNADNRGMDWFFINVGGGAPGASGDSFIDATRAGGAQPFLSVPMMGRVAKDGSSYSFSVTKYGAQYPTECDWQPGACSADKGRGCSLPGSNDDNCVRITTNDPNDSTVAHTETLVTSWMAHISAHLGGKTAANGGQKLYGLDNEPGLWHETHRDAWKPMTSPFIPYAPLGAVEHWNRTRTYAAAIKAQDPAAKILGPSDWLICTAYFTAADHCGPSGPDYANHGSKPFARWYLQKAKEYEQANGVRLIDYFDIHYYPQANGVYSGNEDLGTSSLRLRSIKSLYDPNYTDESWLDDLGVAGLSRQAAIPTLKSWIAAEYPGTKLAIGEYSWGDGPNNGDGSGPSAALAQAEVLAIFAREGVDLATRWVAPPADSLLEDAFKLYLNYDGAGHKVAGETCRATSSNVDAVGAYAQRGPSPTGPLYVLLFNKDTVDHTTPVTVSGLGAATASLYRFTQAPGAPGRLKSAGTASFVAGAASLALPARSATLAVLNLPAAAPAATKFYPVTPCRLLDTRNPNGAFGGPAMGSGTSRTWTASAGACGIPADAKSLSTNLTVTQSAAAGEMRTYPADVGSPNTSAISFKAGATKANNGMIALSPAGAFTIDALVPSGNVHAIVDVNGYFK